MRNPILRWLAPTLLAVVLVVSGCDESPVSVDEEQAAIQALIEENADFFTADLFSGATEEGTTPSLGKALTAITPWRFGRQILSVDRTVDITIDDPGDGTATADVTWNAEITGVFHVIDDQANAWEKDFTDNAVRYATFEKLGPDTAHRRGWRLTGISGTEVLSNPATVGIVSVHLQSVGGVDTTYTDVASLADRESLLTFAPLDTVTVTVTTGNTDDVVLLHHPAYRAGHGGRHHVRRELTNNGDGTYTGTYVTRGLVWFNGMLMAPRRHFTIDVLSDGTVYDDTEPYDSNAWSIIYWVSPD
jgi:hypothetical protein